MAAIELSILSPEISVPGNLELVLVVTVVLIALALSDFYANRIERQSERIMLNQSFAPTAPCRRSFWIARMPTTGLA